MDRIFNSLETQVPLVSDISIRKYLAITVCAVLKLELFLPFQKLEIALLRQHKENGVIFHSSTTEPNMRNAQQRITFNRGVLQ